MVYQKCSIVLAVLGHHQSAHSTSAGLLSHLWLIFSSHVVGVQPTLVWDHNPQGFILSKEGITEHQQLTGFP